MTAPAGEKITRARAREPLDRATVELARVETLDALDAAKERLDEASLSAALPGGDETEMLAAEQDVARLRQKLQGLALGLKRVEASEKERREQDRLAGRRTSALRILSLMQQREWAVGDLEAARRNVEASIGKVSDLGQQIEAEARRWFTHDTKGNFFGVSDELRNFLMSISAIGMTDIAFRHEQGSLRGDLVWELAAQRGTALRHLAKVVPEISDESVKAAAEDDAIAARASTDG